MLCVEILAAVGVAVSDKLEDAAATELWAPTGLIKATPRCRVGLFASDPAEAGSLLVMIGGEVGPEHLHRTHKLSCARLSANSQTLHRVSVLWLL